MTITVPVDIVECGSIRLRIWLINQLLKKIWPVFSCKRAKIVSQKSD